ncbi:uroporphyrinogen-III C-methyltransferase [Ferrovum myxofaciens]|jgi:uroporphyrin-3 C-methyltransferase|uniref:uroporphyrinogen-III C-methyltransferase n=1 Tax=Ferrovum myxofaciens TaxID=416213 RepID=UPI00068F61B0|nr:uroporphyrinogen-III C-methyltransferase [Ferrovum myxofaciens]
MVNEQPPATQKSYLPGRLTLLIILLGLAGLVFYQRNQLLDLRQDLSKRLSQTDQLSQQVQSLAQQANETSRETSTRLVVLESRFSDTQNQQVELAALYQDLMRHRDDWILAEVEQLVIIANQQLELTGNVQSALAALEAADLRLQRLDKPALNHLRENLKQDMDHLRALPYVDTNGITLRLDSMIQQVDGLALASDTRPKPPPLPKDTRTSWLERLTQDMLLELNNAIRIRRMDTPELPLLTPEQTYFLRENLKLRLFAARIDVLARNEVRFRSELSEAQHWLQRYFDTANPAVKNFLSNIQLLTTTPVSVPLPDISATLAAVHAARGGNP